MRRRHLVAVLLLLAVLSVAYGAWTVRSVASSLTAASDSARRLDTALRDGDQPAAREAFDDLEGEAGDAADRTNGPAWAPLTVLPGLGDDLAAVRTVADTLDDLTLAVGPLVRNDAASDPATFAPHGGAVPLAPLRRVQPALSHASTAFARADARLAAVDDSGFVDPLATRFAELRDQVGQGARGLGAASIAADVLPGMLGADGPREHLLVFQNNAEARATGGLPGAVSLLEAEDGRVRLTRQVPGNSFPELDNPVLPITDEERHLFADHLGAWFLDANFTPDFPRAAELWAARWTQEFSQDVDGVVSLDPVALSYVLEATGPVTVDGFTLTPENAADELLNNVYTRVPDPLQQDVWFRAVAEQTFEVISSGRADPRTLLTALSRGVAEGRVRVTSTHDEEQTRLAASAITGDLPGPDSDATDVGVYFNETTASKLSYFLKPELEVTGDCADGDANLTGTLTLASTAPTDTSRLPAYVEGDSTLIGAGTQVLEVLLYGPAGGEIRDVRLDGRRLDFLDTTTHEGRPVTSVSVFLEPRQTSSLEWSMQGTAKPEGLRVAMTPGADATPEVQVTQRDCVASPF